MRLLTINSDVVTLVNNTNKYLRDYLTPNAKWGENVKYYRRLELLLNDAKHADWESIAIYIKNMPYNDFLTTKYWQAITKQKKYNHPSCEKCKGTEKLHTHHPNYDIRGYELFKMDELVVLCHRCHLDEHIDNFNSPLI